MSEQVPRNRAERRAAARERRGVAGAMTATKVGAIAAATAVAAFVGGGADPGEWCDHVHGDNTQRHGRGESPRGDRQRERCAGARHHQLPPECRRHITLTTGTAPHDHRSGRHPGSGCECDQVEGTGTERIFALDPRRGVVRCRHLRSHADARREHRNRRRRRDPQRLGPPHGPGRSGHRQPCEQRRWWDRDARRRGHDSSCCGPPCRATPRRGGAEVCASTEQAPSSTSSTRSSRGTTARTAEVAASTSTATPASSTSRVADHGERRRRRRWGWRMARRRPGARLGHRLHRQREPSARRSGWWPLLPHRRGGDRELDDQQQHLGERRGRPLLQRQRVSVWRSTIP